MGNRRCFSVDVVETDRFIDMSANAQALYFHLGMYTDDDGFVSSPKKIMRSVSCADSHLAELIGNGFVIQFDTGVIVITDFKRQNTIQNDRYKETVYIQEKAQLVEDAQKRYALAKDTNCIQDGNKLYPQLNVTEQNKTERNKAKSKAPPKKATPLTQSYGEYGWVKLSEAQYSKLISDLGQSEVERCIAYIDESAQQTGNKNKWKDWDLVIRKCSREKWGVNRSAQPCQPEQSKPSAPPPDASKQEKGPDFLPEWAD